MLAQALTVIEGPGRLGIDTRQEVERRILAELDAGEPVIVLDLSRTQSIDGAGVGVLFWAQTIARRAGSMLCLVAPPASVRAFLQSLDLCDDLVIHESLEDALQAC